MSNTKQQTNTGKTAGKIIIGVILIYLVLGVLNPSLFFFLSESQQEAVAAFRDTYISSASPIQGGEGFDPLKIAALVIMAIGCYILYKVVCWIISKINFKNKDAKTISGLITNLVKYAIVIYGILFGLSILGVNMGAVIASLGILSLVIGFGAQSLISDVITGMFIILEGQFRVGDVIRLDGFRGTVTNIGIRTTQITDDSGNVEIVNNSDIRNLINLSAEDTTATVSVTVSGCVNLDETDKIMEKLAARVTAEHPELYAKPVKYLGISSFEDEGISLLFVVSADESVIYNSLRNLRKELFVTIQQEGIPTPAGYALEEEQG